MSQLPHHAIIIPGLLRCVDSIFLDFLDSASQFAKIFIVSERSYASIASDLAHRYNASILFDEELRPIPGVNNSFFTGALAQFLKLEIVLELLSDWEAANSHQFDYIHKFRTDVLYNCSFQDYIRPLLSFDFPVECLLNQADYNFSGRRCDVNKFKGICSFVESIRSDQRFLFSQLSSFNADALLRSAVMHPFPIAFPVGVVEAESDIPSFHSRIRSEFANYIDASLAFSQSLPKSNSLEHQLSQIISNSMLARSYFDRYSHANPEHTFAKYVNSQGLAVIHYGHSNLGLRFSRFATTPFTIQVFDEFQNGRFSSLEFDRDSTWKEQIELFRLAGGKQSDLLKILVKFELQKLTNAQVEGLCDLINILNGRDWINQWSPLFIERLKERGCCTLD